MPTEVGMPLKRWSGDSMVHRGIFQESRIAMVGTSCVSIRIREQGTQSAESIS